MREFTEEQRVFYVERFTALYDKICENKNNLSILTEVENKEFEDIVVSFEMEQME